MRMPTAQGSLSPPLSEERFRMRERTGMNRQQHMTTQSLMLPAADAAAYLGMAKSTLLRETRRGNIRAKRIGQQYWYNRTMLEAYAGMEGSREHQDTGTDERAHSV